MRPYRVKLERFTREAAEVEIVADNIEVAKDLAVARAKAGDVIWESDVASVEAFGVEFGG